MRNSRTAYTLVEVLVVTIVIAIIAGIGVVAYKSMTNDANRQQARSIANALVSTLNKYYTKNNEYPSAESLAVGGDGRSMTQANYNTLASILGVKATLLQQSKYKFVPCWASSAPCTLQDSTDAYSILYMTRSASDISSNTSRVYTSPVSGCTYTIPASTSSFDSGYSSYILMYKDAADTNWWTVWNVVTSGSPSTVQGAWCPLTRT